MTWKDDLNFGLAAFGLRIPERVPLDEWTERIGGKPMTNTAMTVAASAVLFYLAERGKNPKVADIWDALIYTSTCLSVGYGDIFARTPAGKMIGTALMTLGPAMAARTLDGPATKNQDQPDSEMQATLGQILKKLADQAEGNAV